MKLLITVDGRAYEVDVEMLEEEEAQPEERAPLAAPLPPLPPLAPLQSFDDSDPKVCCSPVMGLVIKINVEPGQVVEAGELLAVLEAMKMESNVAAPIAGTVKCVHVKAGDPVKLNQPLLEFE